MNAVPLVYLDHAATTPMRPEALEAMLAFYGERFGNPSGSHRVARDARRAIDEARDVVASCLGSRPGEVIFTGCGTESDSLAILGVQRIRGGVAVCPAVEHHAVLDVVTNSGGRVIAVDRLGSVDLDALRDSLDASVSVVSVMAVNNEVGTITDLAEVASVVRRYAPNAALHTDAVQAATWLDLRALTRVVDLLSLSAHKFGGPKGVGLLYVRDGIRLDPMMRGGGQEHERRSGTHNVAGIVAMARALQVTDARRGNDIARIGALRDRLVDGIRSEIDDVVETVPRQRKVAGSAHLCFPGIDSESLLFLLDDAGVCASAASACASGAMEPSHVLSGMGVPRERALGAVRLTVGSTTTEAEIERAVGVVAAAVRRLRAGSVGVGVGR